MDYWILVPILTVTFPLLYGKFNEVIEIVSTASINYKINKNVQFAYQYCHYHLRHRKKDKLLEELVQSTNIYYGSIVYRRLVLEYFLDIREHHFVAGPQLQLH